VATRQGKLTREAVLGAAVELVDRNGLDALSMRSLGGALGVEAMSLYHHVPSKEALLDGVVEAVLDEVTTPAHARGWRAALRALAHRHREAALRHPRVMLLFSSRTLTAPAWRRAVEDTFRALADGGFDERRAVNAYRIFWGYVVGYVHAELRNADSPGLDAYLAALPAGEYPATHAHAAALAGVDRDDEFRLGVELVLDAVARIRRT
jgi:AcrR family transcriptional regulator